MQYRGSTSAAVLSINMVHPNPFIDEKPKKTNYIDSSDEHSHDEKDEIDYYLNHQNSNTHAEPVQDNTISSTEYSPISPYVNRSTSPGQFPPGRESIDSPASPQLEPLPTESLPRSPSPSKAPTSAPTPTLDPIYNFHNKNSL
jgi:hypothetical protein